MSIMPRGCETENIREKQYACTFLTGNGSAFPGQRNSGEQYENGQNKCASIPNTSGYGVV